ncbi:sensor histidine kinase [Pseudomarimonas salicorniae]|uniref:histidine kinase n=1 Tax=Pseudomarimonas salicorniae TaxID=2933270 RepID=A0ABT0GKA0_9GAMM|nr:two-component regulator propeller domain-containing protein [Lysobacter sp. CAU 1642]MCK7594964.1 ATP-binding protein [Lysobacter sp. CAU 1642]
MTCCPRSARRMTRVRIGALLCLLLVSGPLRAQGTALASYHQESWGTAEGLPHNLVLDITQSADGYLWLATWEGTVRFNGHEFEVVDERAVTGLLGRASTELERDPEGRVIAGTERGELLHRDAPLWRVADQGSRMPSLPIYALQVGVDEALIGTAGEGLWQWREGEGSQPYAGAEAISRGIVFAVLRQQDTLWVATDTGLFRDDGRGLVAVGSAEAFGSDGVLSLAQDREGHLLIGSERGAWRLSAGRIEPLHHDLPMDSYEAILVDRVGEIWLGTATHGLLRVGRRGVEHLGSDQGLPSNRVVALFEDSENSLWVGTSRGLFRLREAPFISVTERDGLTDPYTRTLLELPDGRILAGTSSGLFWIERGPEGDRVVASALEGESVLSASLGADGALWIGTYYNGVVRMRDGEVERRFGREEGLPSSQVRALLTDADGALLIGTSRGLTRLKDDAIQRFDAADGLPSESVLSLHRDRAGVLWVGTAAGLVRQEGPRFVAVEEDSAVGGLRIYGFAEDAAGRLHVAHDRGITRLEDGRWRLLGGDLGLPIGAAFSIQFDSGGNYWLSSNRGVLRIGRGEADEAFRQGVPLRSWELFGEADGMASSQGNGAAGLPALASRNGRFWFATAGGVVHVDPVDLERFDRVEPRVRIEQLRIDGQVRPWRSGVVVPAAAQRVEVRFVGLNFQIPKKIRYRYRLEGFDEDWVDSQTQRSAQFTNLAPGQYLLRIQAASPAGSFGPEEARLALEVEPWWWEHPLFRIAALLLGGALAALAVRLRIRRLERQRAELQRRVDQATADLQRQASMLQEQNVELDAYAHSVAHDLKNPLATVVGMSSLVRTIGDGMPDEQRLDMLVRIHAAGLKMVEIIDSLLLLGRARSDSEVALQPLVLGPLIEETLKGFAAEVTVTGAQIETHSGMPEVRGFAPWVERVLSNYIANALKYGGEPPQIEIGATRMGDLVEVWVKDRGQGLSAEAQARLFQPFSRLGRVGGDGHGLGLSIVRRIVERMGGSVGCESRTGEGTRFWFRLPAAYPDKD